MRSRRRRWLFDSFAFQCRCFFFFLAFPYFPGSLVSWHLVGLTWGGWGQSRRWENGRKGHSFLLPVAASSLRLHLLPGKPGPPGHQSRHLFPWALQPKEVTASVILSISGLFHQLLFGFLALLIICINHFLYWIISVWNPSDVFYFPNWSLTDTLIHRGIKNEVLWKKI